VLFVLKTRTFFAIFANFYNFLHFASAFDAKFILPALLILPRMVSLYACGVLFFIDKSGIFL
jgi:hypothetical protein